jgi:predicted PurR-regulated permease PerM
MSETSKIEIASVVIMGAGLYAVLQIGLLGALLPGLLIFHVVHLISPMFHRMGLNHDAGRTVALAVPLIIVSVAVGLGILELIDFVTGPNSFVELMHRMAEIVGTSREYLPTWAQQYLPTNVGEIEAAGANWLRENAGLMGQFGQNAGRVAFHIVIGMIVGGLVAFYSGTHDPALGPLARALEDRCEFLSNAFRNIVFSQIRISALNTFLTSIYLAVVLPIMGVNLPLLKTMIAVTFIAGLLPVIGNLISNTVIVIVSLSVGPLVAAGSLAFLVIIHKLEYFVNARIIGTRIKARAWELLAAMMVAEAWFGIPGLIAAPIYYAYLKDELKARGLI